MTLVVDQNVQFPWFVSDEATLFDVCTLSEVEIRSRLRVAYASAPEKLDLQLPIWRLVDLLLAATAE